jgi:hypothetical protein
VALLNADGVESPHRKGFCALRCRWPGGGHFAIVNFTLTTPTGQASAATNETCDALAPAVGSANRHEFGLLRNRPDASLLLRSKVDRKDEAARRHRKKTEIPPMAVKKPRTAKLRATAKKQGLTAIFEEVEKLEDITPRMVELLLTEPEGTRIYLRVRDRRIIN